MLDKEVWNKKHSESVGRYNRVTDFARLCQTNFIKQKKCKLLDLCCGKGADSIFFHNKGLKVSTIDYSGEAIKQFNDIQKKYSLFITALVRDVTESIPFEDNSFDFIYSRLGLHYFTNKELKKIASEIERVLKSEGLLMFQVKSTRDKNYGVGKKLEKDMYEDETGYVRHFFNIEYVEELFKEFNIIMCEERNVNNVSSYLEVVLEKK
ncbi:MAG: class I SAM-dependent methyltransferase [Nanoarchaeota archaeon]